MLIESTDLGKLRRILIEDSVLRNLRAFRQVDALATEAGGILLGYRRDPHIHISAATGPGTNDRRSRFHFSREDPSHQRFARSQWQRSARTLDYVGEWHTHPEINPQPSHIDFEEWRRLSVSRADAMIFVIQGTERLWVGCGVGGAISKLEIFGESAPR